LPSFASQSDYAISFEDSLANRYIQIILLEL
jgi:hypothetical protein